MNDENFEDRLREEIELARALTAVLLAVRLDVAESKAQDAFERVVGHASPAGN